VSDVSSSRITPRVRTSIVGLAWLAIAIPALYQVMLLGAAIAGRLRYPYDLEWMEGGMLHHALRLQQGHSLYAPPSIDFIPYLYTPLYPALLAALGKIFGLTYTLGRAISVISLAGIAGVAMWSIVPGQDPLDHNDSSVRRVLGAIRVRIANPIAWCGVALAMGLFAAIYPYVEGWYDLVRADTLFLMMVTAAIATLPYLATTGDGWRGHARVATGAVILGLSFFCKQTGIFYVGLGGVIVLASNWRRTPVFVSVCGVIGLGGTALMNASTGGWFWTYVSKIHRAHDFNMDRFWKSFGNILWHFPALTIVVVGALIFVAATRVVKGVIPIHARPLLLWSATFAVSTVVGAIGWGTEFAHFNAYMPAFLHGALAAGAAVPAVAACVRVWRDEARVSQPIAAVVAIALAVTCYHARWNPAPFVPQTRDVVAGDKLIKRIAALDGDVWMPSHPWYLELAGKTPHVHRMGVKDVTTRQSRTIIGLDDALAKHQFSAIVMDDRDLYLELPALTSAYRPAFKLPLDERPRVFTGAHVVPDAIWVPRVAAAPPAGAKVVFDFEAPTWSTWSRSGMAWGDGPVAEAEPGQDLVFGVTGQRFATSMHGGDVATGRVTSPAFTLEGAKLTFLIGGGTDASKLRVELWVDGTIARTSGVPGTGGDVLQTVTWTIAELAGKPATLVLVDDSPTGHLDLDDVWLWAYP
jgi:hypothetical protein